MITLEEILEARRLIDQASSDHYQAVRILQHSHDQSGVLVVKRDVAEKVMKIREVQYNALLERRAQEEIEE